MAEVKNDFLKSKMNKDLDDRLVPKGEYRHAQNISVAKSEGSDVGAIENILGNISIADFLTETGADEKFNVEIIGHFMDVKNDRIIVFMTNYVDTSASNLDNFSPAGAYHGIGIYNILNNTSSIIVNGRFLNFSKTHEIYNIDMIENLLYWTDNRNQPRKINLESAYAGALASTPYYTTEDTISVSKYYPYQTMELLEEEVISGVLTNGGIGYTVSTNDLPTRAIAPSVGVGLTVNVTSLTSGWPFSEIDTFTISNTGHGYKDGDVVKVNRSSLGGYGGNAEITLTTEIMGTMRDVTSEKLPDGTTYNPYRQPYGSGAITWKGDPEYLKDKFVRFSYRFKFDDGEYSLIAPFTQTCFVPKQDGYFIGNDDAKTFKSTEVDFMQNKINDITLLINSPIGNWSDITNTMKIVEVDIIYKEAGQNAVKVVDTIFSNEINLIESSILRYNYKSTQPWKTLPSSDILRVHDQVPVRAFTQEVIGDRLIYGNYIDKPTPPASINYSLSTSVKSENTQKEYQNSTLKQNRSYQVGVVLSDRYGRQSTVILSSLDDNNVGERIKGSSIFHDFKISPFSNNGQGLFDSTNVWDGDACNVTFWDGITSGVNVNSLWHPNHENGEPGLYDAITNPLGWYSYKIVVKQVEQDYYNVYVPGILNGYADGDGFSTAATADEPICHFALHGDNINKIPRDLSLVGPTQTTFRTGRPSVQEDPSYYQFVDASGDQFTVDPFSEEGERLLKERDREKDLDSGSQITNSSVKLSLRLNNAAPDAGLNAVDTTTHQAYPGTSLDLVSTIGTGTELGLWDPGAPSPYNTCHSFYGYKDNPYIAKTIVSAPTTTGLTGPHPLSGKLNFKITSNNSGAGYMPGSKNLLCTIPISSYGSVGQGFRVNIDDTDVPGGPGKAKYISIADPGQGWNTLMDQSVGDIQNCLITGGGTTSGKFSLGWTKTLFEGTMAPSLAVYETQPLKSKLNIYWETSTNGLIEDLNQLILDDNISTPIRIAGEGGNQIWYAQDESMNIGTYVSGGIYPYNFQGYLVPGLISVDIVSAKNRFGMDHASEFDVEIGAQGIADGFMIKTNNFFMCGSVITGFRTFTFVVEIVVPGTTPGNTITRQFTLGPYTITNKQPNIIIFPTAGNFLANTPANTSLTSQSYELSLPQTRNWSIINGTTSYTGPKTVRHKNEVSDYQNVYEPATGIFKCNVAGVYNIFYEGKWSASAACDFGGNSSEPVRSIGAIKGYLSMEQKNAGSSNWNEIESVECDFDLDTADWNLLGVPTSSTDNNNNIYRNCWSGIELDSASNGTKGFLNNDNAVSGSTTKYLSKRISLNPNDEIRISFKGIYSSIYKYSEIFPRWYGGITPIAGTGLTYLPIATNINPYQTDPRYNKVFAGVGGAVSRLSLGKSLYANNKFGNNVYSVGSLSGRILNGGWEPINFYTGTATVHNDTGKFYANGLAGNITGGKIFEFTANNGAFIGSGLEHQSITWTLIDPATGVASTLLYLVPLSNGRVELWNSPGGSSGDSLGFEITAKDGALASTSITSEVLLL